MADATVIRLPTEREPLAQMLERIVSEVRAGKITNLAIATVFVEDGEECTGAGWTAVDSKRRPMLLLGAVTYLRRRIEDWLGEE